MANGLSMFYAFLTAHRKLNIYINYQLDALIIIYS